MAYGYFTGTLGDYLRTVSFTVTNGASNEKKTYSNIKIFRLVVKSSWTEKIHSDLPLW